MYFIVDKVGDPIRMRRYVFSESFAAIAYAAYYKATGNRLDVPLELSDQSLIPREKYLLRNINEKRTTTVIKINCSIVYSSSGECTGSVRYS